MIEHWIKGLAEHYWMC